MRITATLLFTLALGLTACQKDDTTASTTPQTSSDLPAVYKKFTTDVQVYQEGNYIVVKSKGVPNHKSPYFNSTDSRYEKYNGSNPQFQLNPNRIQEFNLVFKFPVNPQEAASKSQTPMGPIGVSLNGVPFFNQYAAQRAPLTGEINSFDQYNGHPQQQGQYHYHMEPSYLTNTLGKDKLLGFLLDGFPVYGPVENGKTVSNADLDAYHGHKHATADFPNGIYHYHITSADPYINGSGYFGTAGTVSY